MTKLQHFIAAERSLMLFGLSRLVLWLAVASNVGRAIVAFRGTRTDDALGQSWLTAIALEGALALSAYTLAERRASGQRTGALWAVAVLFCVISASANIAYFAAGVPIGPALLAPVLWGLAAPLVAIANAWLSGSMTGSEVARQDQAAQEAHAERIAELTAQTEKARASAARAEARRVKAESATVSIPVSVPVIPSVPVSRPDRAAFLAEYPNMADMKPADIVSLTGIQERTARNWRAWAIGQRNEDGNNGRH